MRCDARKRSDNWSSKTSDKLAHASLLHEQHFNSEPRQNVVRTPSGPAPTVWLKLCGEAPSSMHGRHESLLLVSVAGRR
jgi:hypothetical protein